MSDIASFKQSFKGDVVTPGDADYKQAIARWALNAERPARVVAFVKDTDDIALALKYAETNNLKIAIRCGGHSPAGASSIQDGLVIDLSRYFNYAVADAEKRTVRVGGGTLWGTVDKEAIQHGLATVGGTVNHTGVAGLLLGGGYGFLSGQYGMVVDNVLQATLVTANGEVLTVNENQNSELFWGIRGGGSNFGVCTEFVLKLYPQRRTVFAGMVIFTPNMMDALMNELSEWWKTVKDHEAILQISLTCSFQPFIALSLFYNGSEEEGRANFKRFFDLKPIMDTAREIPYEQLNAQSNEMFAHGQNYYLKSAYQNGPQPDVVKRIEHCYVFEYVPYRNVVSVPQDATAHLRFPRTTTVCFLKWPKNSPEAEQAAKLHARELTDLVADAVQLPGVSNTGYGNYSSEVDSETTLTMDRVLDESKSRGLFGVNYDRLQRLKARYDPDNVFTKWFAIAPKA
ncbi:hypothetical protein BC834DRAFT_971227 [Gloeopeniophorella convolvens]|nr:hypothetical protein BC834DRAFT_971227 [Gloeopeniophorella convolvens]